MKNEKLQDNMFVEKNDEKTIIENEEREFLDQKTGELVHVDQVIKRSYGTKQFWKVYLMDFLSILGIVDSRQLDIFIYIVENTKQSENLFIGTYEKIAKATGASTSTIAIIMKKLQNHNFITKVQNGLWRINPNIMMKGNENKRQILLSYYQEEVAENAAIEISRGRTKELPERKSDFILKSQLNENFISDEINEVEEDDE
jgi:Firmicute plasmid replication protein (RepL).